MSIISISWYVHYLHPPHALLCPRVLLICCTCDLIPSRRRLTIVLLFVLL